MGRTSEMGGVPDLTTKEGHGLDYSLKGVYSRFLDSPGKFGKTKCAVAYSVEFLHHQSYKPA